MESQLIYTASTHLRSKINWKKVTNDTEWIYIGNKESIDWNNSLTKIYSYFQGNILNLASNRSDSIQLNKADLQKKLLKSPWNLA
jgi:hypothetical protein